MIKHLIKKLFGQAGYAVLDARNRYGQDGLFTTHNDHFRQDPSFRAAYRRGVEASNGIDPEFEWRVHVALWAAASALRVAGDFVECGVNAGFISSAIMQRLDWNRLDRRFYLIDTFEGPVLSQFSTEEIERGRLDLAERALTAGAYVTDLDRVRANCAEWSNAVVVKGAVPEVLFTQGFGEVAFLHIDMNCAYPERAALEFFWTRMPPGGIVLLDDYAYFGHERQADAIDAAVRTLGGEVLSLPTGQGLIIR